MVKQVFKHLKKFLPVVGIIILVLYVYFRLDIEKIKFILRSIDLIHLSMYIAIALTLTIPRVLIRNTAWQLILKEQRIKIGFWQSLKVFLIGYFYGSFTPGYLGQLMRVPYMKEKTKEPYGKLFVNSCIETIIHTFSIYIMIIIGAILIIGTFPQLLYFSVLWFLIVILILLFFIKRERGEKLFYTLIKFLIPKKLKNDFNRFVDTFYIDFPKIKNLILPVIIASFTWVIIFSQEYIFVIAFGLEIPYIYFLLLFPVANVVGFIPISFAGLGLREITAIEIFTLLFSVEREEVLIVSLMGFLITDVVTGFVGFLVSLTESRENIKD